MLTRISRPVNDQRATDTLAIPAKSAPANAAQARLLSYLQWMTASTKEHRQGYWVGIHSNTLRQIGGQDYARELRKLEAAKKIEINDRYSVGKFAKSYRLASRFRTGEFEVIQSRKSSFQQRHRIRLDDDDAVGHKLVERMNVFTLPASLRCKGWDHFNATAIHSGRYYAKRCPYGRLHSTFTGLPRKVREHLLADGDRTLETDVKNCQPLFLGLLASTAARLKIPTEVRSSENSDTQPAPATCCLHVDIGRYLAACCEGQLYETLASAATAMGMTLHDFIPQEKRHRYGSDRALRRKDVKKTFLVLMFADEPMTRQLPLFDVVEELYPSIAEFIIEAKRDDHHHLARRCQRFESSLMVGPGGVADQLMQEEPSAPIITIHDSVRTTPRYAALAGDIIRSIFTRAGATPTVTLADQ